MKRIVPLLALELVLAGCTGRQPAPASPARGLPWVALVQPDQPNATTAAVVSAISEHNALREVPLAQPLQRESRAAAVRKGLKQGRQDYFTAFVDRARQQLERALQLARRTFAVGLDPKDLAEIHLYLAAVDQATQAPARAREHLDAALRFFPTLELDRSLFPPQLRQALEKRRRRLGTAQLKISTQPPGATILWDGGEVGRAPVTLPEASKGEHFLVAYHPLSKARREHIVVTTAAQLELQLEPASPGEIAAGLRQNPELARAGLELLGVNAVAWVDGTDEGAVVRSLSLSGARETKVQRGTSPDELTRVARSLCREAPRSSPRHPEPRVTRKKKERKRKARAASTWRRYWWAWTAAGVVLVGAAVALPLALQDGSDPSGRPVVMEIP